MDYKLLKLGIIYLSDLLGMDAPNLLLFSNNEFYPHSPKIAIDIANLQGKYISDIDSIIINCDLCRDNTEWLVMFHELRHAYQIQECNHDAKDRIEDSTLVKVWRDNFKNYIPFNNDGYAEQPVELDANVYTAVISLKLFGKPVDIYNLKKEKYFDYYTQMMNDFSTEELKTVFDDLMPMIKPFRDITLYKMNAYS